MSLGYVDTGMTFITLRTSIRNELQKFCVCVSCLLLVTAAERGIGVSRTGHVFCERHVFEC